MARESWDRASIAERKNVCAGCGAELVRGGALQREDRGEAFECSNESCGYREHRLYSESYGRNG